MRSARAAAQAAANATNETQTTETVRTVKQAVIRNLLASCPRCIVYSLHLVISVVAHTPVHPLALQRMTRDPHVYPNLVVVNAPPRLSSRLRRYLHPAKHSLSSSLATLKAPEISQ